jgi:hypothetical protein
MRARLMPVAGPVRHQRVAAICTESCFLRRPWSAFIHCTCSAPERVP